MSKDDKPTDLVLNSNITCRYSSQQNGHHKTARAASCTRLSDGRSLLHSTLSDDVDEESRKTRDGIVRQTDLLNRFNRCQSAGFRVKPKDFAMLIEKLGGENEKSNISERGDAVGQDFCVNIDLSAKNWSQVPSSFTDQNVAKTFAFCKEGQPDWLKARKISV